VGEVDSTGTIVLTAPLNEYVDGGALWMECTAIGGPVTSSVRSMTMSPPSIVTGYRSSPRGAGPARF